MSEIMSGMDHDEEPESEAVGGLDAVDEQLVAQLVSRARAGGLQLTGEGGVLQQLTKRLLESALEGEITDHLGYDKHDPVGRTGGNSRNGTRAKTMLTDVGPVELDVPRDREGSFEPKIVAKRQKRLAGVDEMVISQDTREGPPQRWRWMRQAAGAGSPFSAGSAGVCVLKVGRRLSTFAITSRR